MQEPRPPEAVLNAFADWLQRWADYTRAYGAWLEGRGEPPPEMPGFDPGAEAAGRLAEAEGASAVGEPSPDPAGEPPAHWQEAAGRSGPPAHWLALFADAAREESGPGRAETGTEPEGSGLHPELPEGEAAPPEPLANRSPAPQQPAGRAGDRAPEGGRPSGGPPLELPAPPDLPRRLQRQLEAFLPVEPAGPVELEDRDEQAGPVEPPGPAAAALPAPERPPARVETRAPHRPEAEPQKTGGPESGGAQSRPSSRAVPPVQTAPPAVDEAGKTPRGAGVWASEQPPSPAERPRGQVPGRPEETLPAPEFHDASPEPRQSEDQGPPRVVPLRPAAPPPPPPEPGWAAGAERGRPRPEKRAASPDSMPVPPRLPQAIPASPRSWEPPRPAAGSPTTPEADRAPSSPVPDPAAEPHPHPAGPGFEEPFRAAQSGAGAEDRPAPDPARRRTRIHLRPAAPQPAGPGMPVAESGPAGGADLPLPPPPAGERTARPRSAPPEGRDPGGAPAGAVSPRTATLAPPVVTRPADLPAADAPPARSPHPGEDRHEPAQSGPEPGPGQVPAADTFFRDWQSAGPRSPRYPEPPDDFWPDLPPPTPERPPPRRQFQDPGRRARLDREQRGNLWNA